jgi:NAD-dependent DNA ligase
MTQDPSDEIYKHFNRERISSRQVDELIGLSRGLCADGVLNDAEVEFLQKWLVANLDASQDRLLAKLYRRVDEVLRDGFIDNDERTELFDTLKQFADTTFELGEVLKPTTIPLCSPAPQVTFRGRSFCFTGNFNFGRRPACEQAVTDRGGFAGSLTKNTNYLVIGAYVTDSWKHSTYGLKIMKAVEMRDNKGVPISIVSEHHWANYL